MIWTYNFDRPPELSDAELHNLLGGKGANLSVMATRLGLPVPPGFVITTEACKAYIKSGWPDGLEAELQHQLKQVEEVAGRRFGDPANPLLLSVRSGAPVSMPGMLDTILNLGLNRDTTLGLAKVSGDARFANACRERLDSMFRDIVGTSDVPEDPWQQLQAAVQAVFRSWDSERARSYRETEGIPEHLGTAVVVQAMVFGNRGPESATGVLFTRNPATGENVLYGDVLFEAQGEDVVAGTHATQPIEALDDRLPDVGAELRRYAQALERHYADVCDIEFTIEEGKLWMLQNRIGKRGAQAALRIAIEMAEDESFPLKRAEAVERVAAILVDPPKSMLPNHEGDLPIVAVGLPASPGLATGAIATSPEAAVKMAAEGRDVILVRSETSPDDVHGMAVSVGVLTSTGGLASHAAVVARGWDIPAVVGARDVIVDHGRISIGARMWKEGDVISIDGSTGDVYGEAIGSEAVASAEARTLLRWAREAEIDIEAAARRAGRAPAADPTNTAAALAPIGEASPDDVIRSLSIKGYVTSELLAPVLGCTQDQATALLAELVERGAAKENSGMFSLTDAGKRRGAGMLAADQSQWSLKAAASALDDFIALDERMKQVVTAWQMKEVDGEPVLNDHADEAYDASVLADLAALHVDASTWLARLVDGLPRLSSYAARLDAAAAAAAAGDQRFIASPRVDSYHSVWFELHEDLIRLAGKTREGEVAAGRA